MNKQKKPYTPPDLEIVKTHFENDILTGSVEEYKEYIDDGGDWGDDPIIDPDDEIDW